MTSDARVMLLGATNRLQTPIENRDRLLRTAVALLAHLSKEATLWVINSGRKRLAASGQG